MKKVLISVAVVAAFGMASCGGPDACECMNEKAGEESDACKELAEERAKELKEADEEGKKKLQDEWAKEAEGCEKDSKDGK